MASINVEIRERKKVIVELRQDERLVDTAQEAIQRLLKQVESRKRKAPELADIMKLLALVNILDGLVAAFADKLEASAEMFAESSTSAEQAGLRDIGIDLGVVKGENVLVIDPILSSSYIKYIFKNQKNLEKWLAAHPEYADQVIGTGVSADNIKWGY
jgi:hypothetical protein